MLYNHKSKTKSVHRTHAFSEKIDFEFFTVQIKWIKSLKRAFLFIFYLHTSIFLSANISLIEKLILIIVNKLINKSGRKVPTP